MEQQYGNLHERRPVVTMVIFSETLGTFILEWKPGFGEDLKAFWIHFLQLGGDIEGIHE